MLDIHWKSLFEGSSTINPTKTVISFALDVFDAIDITS